MMPERLMERCGRPFPYGCIVCFRVKDSLGRLSPASAIREENAISYIGWHRELNPRQPPAFRVCRNPPAFGQLLQRRSVDLQMELAGSRVQAECSGALRKFHNLVGLYFQRRTSPSGPPEWRILMRTSRVAGRGPAITLVQSRGIA